ncbi:phosphatidylinositol 4-phosphate 5-kinase (macronuclear) [Tetrahymena thermophila SB210]|uniref:Phosphatidylinositol 4-phosphate 5-kinase n=1 Tax=Tetrahymena thermophila (strain SB210) TaxID=312017 RepID=Q23CS7_TETTS|nr:phosphatidylinositol 4-phosphate 5-kinase [Tetrahymena thermophila SB210]EAR94558.1 phosphatidylinositol 4-phosphate 5-kinase [Tetrahymena thermophila SB210]|eukprot:XP_001014959.1 phosphatidylinositol 4-phosphate 5-kinase [Tetrahymena thermophila SB210]
MKGGSILKQSADRISHNISSGTIVDLIDVHNPTFMTNIKNVFKNKLVLNTTESIFLDFKKSTFHEVARDKYFDTLTAYKRKDKVDLMKHLSIPLYDIFKLSMKQNRPLPFTLYEDVKDIQFYMARIYSQHKHANNPNQTWHQVTCKFVYYDKLLGKEVAKFNVFERRESDTNQKDWRICHFD